MAVRPRLTDLIQITFLDRSDKIKIYQVLLGGTGRTHT